MTLTPAMVSRFTTERNVDWREAVMFSHPSLSAWVGIVNHDQAIYGALESGGVQLYFQPVPFRVQLPIRDGQGQQDLGLIVCNVGKEMYNLISEASADPTQPIRCRYTMYILGDPNPQLNPPLDLSLTNISLDELVMTATATRAQVFSLPFPRLRYRPDNFPGLNRR